jgi:hypothetical protein
MVAFATKDFGGEVPRKDPRFLPDDMAEVAINCDLASGPLDGLPIPMLVMDLTGSPGTVRKAYRFPGPRPGIDPDVWLPLPSEFSSVVRSPLANDTLHRIYWTNPPNCTVPGAFWNTYARIAAGNAGLNAPWNIGFIAPDPAITLTVTPSGGSVPALNASAAPMHDPGAGYIPGSILTVVGGTLLSGSAPASFNIVQTQAATITIANAGTGATAAGVQRTWGTTGAGSLLIIDVNVPTAGGGISTITNVFSHGGYTVNPTDITNEPLQGLPGLTGATVTLTMGAFETTINTGGVYTATPANPAATTCSGPGAGATLDVQYLQTGIPEVARSYLFTYIDIHGEESSPSNPSVTVDGASDGTWTISGLPTVPPGNPAGKSYPSVANMRLYRTITGTSSAAQFYQVADISFGSSVYTDTLPDTTVVNNNTLVSASFAPPPDGLDSLVGLQGGMLAGFTGNTIHFCEPDRPNAWPAGYDQSLQYQIQGFGVWQNSLVVLTEGFPSTGTGTAPSNFTFSQVQVPEPCISRGSIITDLMGVYYASQNGLVMLNYYGMQNQTLSSFTKNIWLTEYHAANIIACRHRAQYLAINATGTGFIIDYTEPRLGVVHLNTFLNVVAVWNDVYSGDTYMIADKKVYLWDSPVTSSLTYRWRSKQFYFPAPTNLGACQISSDPSIENVPTTVVAPLDNLDPTLVLPSDANAVFNLYSGPDGRNLIYSKKIHKTREIFRLPSGMKTFGWQYEIISRVPIHSVELASTMKELGKV